MFMTDRAKFKHKTQLQVRSYEIDWQGIVHNSVYLLYFETGRIGYLRELGVKVDLHAVQHESKVVVVRNEVDYRSPARFGETLQVYTRVSSIRNSSFAFEAFMEEMATKRLVAQNVSIHAWLDHMTNEARPVPDGFRKIVQAFEGNNAIIQWPAYDV